LDPPDEPAIGTAVRLSFERYSDLKVPAFMVPRNANAGVDTVA
jgi:hypothetical protein